MSFSRAKAHEAYIEMAVRDALEKRVKEKALERASKREKLLDAYLDNALLAAEQQRLMLEWPLELHETVNEVDEEGRPTKITKVYPARFSKRTAADLHQMVHDGAGEAERVDLTVRNTGLGKSSKQIDDEFVEAWRAHLGKSSEDDLE
jgi:hypothetical protein